MRLGCGTPAAVTGTHAVRCCSKGTKCPDRIANPQLLPSWSGHMKFGALLPTFTVEVAISDSWRLRTCSPRIRLFSSASFCLLVCLYYSSWPLSFAPLDELPKYLRRCRLAVFYCSRSDDELAFVHQQIPVS